MKAIPLFGDSIQSASSFISSQRRLNCIYEIRSDGDKNNLVIISTPGLQLFITLPSSPIRGWVVVRGVMYVVAGNILFSVTSGGGYSNLGTIATSSSGYVGMSDNGLQVLIVDGVGGWIYNITTVPGDAYTTPGYFGKITDANFPNGATSAVYLHGRFSVNLPNSQQWYTGGSYTGFTWTPLIFNTKTDHSDLLLALTVIHDTMVLWGTTSIEFFQDTGAYPNPYGRIPGVTQDWGLAAVNAKCIFNNSVAFLGQNTQGQVQILVLNGYIPQRISNHDIEFIINEISEYYTIGDAVMYSYMYNGHILLQITFPSGDRSLLFDASTGIWSDTQTGVVDPGNTARHIGNLSIPFASGNYVSDISTGNIYYYDDEAYTDNGQTIVRQVRSRHITGGGNYAQIGMIQLDMETGVGLQSGQGSAPKIMMQISRDGGKTFEGERWVSVGTVGSYTNKVVWRRIGQAMDFVFQFTMTDPVAFNIVQAWADPESDLYEV
jgi:hypothetical protein